MPATTSPNAVPEFAPAFLQRRMPQRPPLTALCGCRTCNGMPAAKSRPNPVIAGLVPAI